MLNGNPEHRPTDQVLFDNWNCNIRIQVHTAAPTWVCITWATISHNLFFCGFSTFSVFIFVSGKTGKNIDTTCTDCANTRFLLNCVCCCCRRSRSVYYVMLLEYFICCWCSLCFIFACVGASSGQFSMGENYFHSLFALLSIFTNSNEISVWVWLEIEVASSRCECVLCHLIHTPPTNSSSNSSSWGSNVVCQQQTKRKLNK